MATKKKTTTKKGAPKNTAPKLTQAPTMSTPKPKVRVLAYCDSPSCATGFGTVARNILAGLHNTGRYAIDILGINYWGDPHNFPFRIWPTGTNSEKDPYGRKKVFSMIPRMEYDILFFLQDSFILDFLPQLHTHLRGASKDFRSICYFPVDGTPKEQWMRNVDATDYPVAYTEFGKEEAIKAHPGMKDLLVIPHGANVSDYFVADEKDVLAFKSQFFGAQRDKFVFTNLNRNQQRKDIPRTIAAFAEFRKQVPESLLYLHMAKQDQGWNLEEVVQSYGLSTSEDVIFPQNFGPNQGYPRQIVNMIYNISDCVISTTLGEGWGLCLHGDTRVMTGRGQIPIKDIDSNDSVIVGGASFPIRATSSDKKTTEYKIKLYNNQELSGSSEHKLPTGDDVYKSMSEISTDDWLVIDKAVLRKDKDYTYDLSKYSDCHDDYFVWNKMGFSPVQENSISNIMSFTGETKKVVETAITAYCSASPATARVAPVVDYLEDIAYSKPEPKKINRSITFDDDFSRLLGYYVAEGSNEAGVGIEFSFHKDEREYHEDVRRLILTYFGVDCDEETIDNKHRLRVRSSILAKFFGELCGVHAHNKHIPLLCLQHKQKAVEFIKGCWRGDGHFGDVEFSYSTASSQLKEELMWLMTAFNIFSKCNLNSSGNWNIYVNGEDYNLLADILGLENTHDTFKERKYLKKFDRFFLLKVKEVFSSDTDDLYYDISVVNKGHFVANGILVHNSWTEAMATKTPIIMPANTAMVENITEDRGYLVKSGTSSGLYTVLPHDNEVIRPLVDVDDMVEKMLAVYNDREEASRRAENAYKWIHSKLDWQSVIVPKWVEVFDNAYKDLKSGVPVPTEADLAESIIEAETF